LGSEFIGRFEHSLDIKGRIILPVRFRNSFDTQAYLTIHHEGCVGLWTPDEFQTQLAQRAAVQDRSREDRNAVRRWSSRSTEIELDRQGRVPLPAFMRDETDLVGSVLVVGAITHVEIWDPEKWLASVEAGAED
jgi:MraZ protein